VTKSLGILPPKLFWIDAELGLLRDLYADVPTSDIAALLDCTLPRVYSMAKNLGLSKSEEFERSVHSGRVQRGKQDPKIKATQFKPGQTSWNKGTHFCAGGRSVETQFKKGQMRGAAQHNYVPIGTVRFHKDGYLERKVTDNPALVPARRWVAVHRLVWEAKNGPIPKSHVVAYKPGQRTTTESEITVDRLELISRAEMARRNHPSSRHGPEIGKLIQLKGAITRQINRISRENQERKAA